jgi:hypothetical protein
MSIELSDQSGEYDAGRIVEVAPIICLKNIIDSIQRSYQNISLGWFVGNFDSRSCNAFLCPLSDSALRAAGKHDFLQRITTNNLKDTR